MKDVAVFYQSQDAARAKELAQQLGCDTTSDVATHEFILLLAETGLQLRWNKYPKTVFRPDFNAGMVANLRKTNAPKPLLAKAIGFKKYKHPSILDVSAGWGEDGVCLALLGADVTLIERHPVIAALLHSAVAFSCDQYPWFAALHLRSTTADALDYMQQLDPEQYPDVIYCDPMFSDLKQTALVKKEMQLLRALVGESTDSKELEALLEMALSIAKHRVVLKRHRLAPTWRQPDIVYDGKSTRFDVYLCCYL